jgi:hypothetical protein
VQGVAGHATVKMTERYYPYTDEHQQMLQEYFPQVVNI